jgi:hypothetical protein
MTLTCHLYDIPHSCPSPHITCRTASRSLHTSALSHLSNYVHQSLVSRKNLPSACVDAFRNPKSRYEGLFELRIPVKHSFPLKEGNLIILVARFTAAYQSPSSFLPKIAPTLRGTTTGNGRTNRTRMLDEDTAS